MEIYITLDYELALGPKTGTVDNCLIRPMNELMMVLSITNTKVTVMVDGAYLFRMDQLRKNFKEIETDYSKVLQNIKKISEEGHDIQYHFHPQWLFSDYSSEYGWKVDFDHYKFSDVSMDVLLPAFKSGFNIISNCIGKNPCAFRAGGFSLCTYDYYGPLFDECGIKIDSSVIEGAYIRSKLQDYDYRNVPNKTRYYFKKEIDNEVEFSQSCYVEMPISHSNPITSLHYLYEKRKIMKVMKNQKKYGDGLSSTIVMPKLQRVRELLSKFFGFMNYGASIDGLLSAELKRVYNDCKKRGETTMVILGHPKLASDESLKNVETFVNDMIIQGNKFCTFSDLYKDIYKYNK